MPSSYGQASVRGIVTDISKVTVTDGDRCERLGKNCVSSASVRKLTSRRAPGSRTAEIEHLEKKIEELVTLLRNQTPEKSSTQIALDAIAVKTPGTSTHSPYCESVAYHPPAGVVDGNATRYPSGMASVSSTKPFDQVLSDSNVFPVSNFDTPSNLRSHVEPSPLQAEESLSFFRKHMLTLFPFVFLAPDMTAKQLRERSPFLWFNIMAVTARTPGQQSAMSDHIKRFAAQKMVVHNEKNLDLLLGLLVFINWFHFHRKDKSYVTVMASLAKSLVYDMELNKANPEPAATPCRKPPHKVKTMAERRAVLACFIVTSQQVFDLRAAYAQKKIDTLEWTPYMDECLQTISQSPEQPGDEYLAAQVMIQLLVEQLRRGRWNPQDYLSPSSSLGPLHVQMEKIKTQLSPTLQQNSKPCPNPSSTPKTPKIANPSNTLYDHKDNIATFLLYTDLLIQDSALFSKIPCSNPPFSAYNPNPQRHQLLTTHLDTLTRWFDLFFAIPLDLYAAISFASWCHMAHALMLLHRLYMLDEPAWDRTAVSARLDLFALCDRLAAILDNTAKGQDVFIIFAKMVRSMRTGWLAEVPAAEWRQPQQPHMMGQESFQMGSCFEMSMPFAMAGDDDAWLQNFLNV
ncbi:MAG: hypothetical protein Q9195_007637 [Heterodermia aff. obscurata]